MSGSPTSWTTRDGLETLNGALIVEPEPPHPQRAAKRRLAPDDDPRADASSATRPCTISSWESTPGRWVSPRSSRPSARPLDIKARDLALTVHPGANVISCRSRRGSSGPTTSAVLIAEEPYRPRRWC